MMRRELVLLFICEVPGEAAGVVAPTDLGGSIVRDAGFFGAPELLPVFGPNRASLFAFALHL